MKVKRIRKEIFIALLLVIVFLFTYITTKKDIFVKLNGKDVTININDQYVDNGIDAEYCFKFIKYKCIKIKNIDIKSNVNTSKKGIYEVTYTAYYKGKIKTIKRKVTVKDTEAPKIILNEDTNMYKCPSKEFVEPGFNVIDNYDQNLNDKVIIEKEKYGIKYSVVDSSGNKSEVFRKFKYSDNSKPRIILNGYKFVFLKLNNEFVDDGYTAFDSCGVDITNKVKVKSNVNINKEGIYEISYYVIDDYGFETKAIRKVKVNMGIKSNNGKVIYLTFDDGPSIYTEKLLNILDDYGVKVTFFVTTQFSNYSYLIKKEYENGHSIGLHTASHNFKYIYSSVDAYFNDINKVSDVVFKETNTYSKLVRFAGGSSNTVSNFNKGIMTKLVKELSDKGYKYFDWNVDSNDTSTTNTDTIINNVINGIKNKQVSVVLQHDIKPASIEATRQIIEYGLSNGYTFLPLNQNSPGAHHGLNN